MENYNHIQPKNSTEAEGDISLMSLFKTAANSVALLYKEADTQSKKAYNSGYMQCLKDVWEFASQKQRHMSSEIMVPKNGETVTNDTSSSVPAITLHELLQFLESKHHHSVLSSIHASGLSHSQSQPADDQNQVMTNFSSHSTNRISDPSEHPPHTGSITHHTPNIPAHSPSQLDQQQSFVEGRFHLEAANGPPHSAPSISIFEPNLPLLTQEDIMADGLKRRWVPSAQDMFHPRLTQTYASHHPPNHMLESPSKRLRVRKDEQMTDE